MVCTPFKTCCERCALHVSTQDIRSAHALHGPEHRHALRQEVLRGAWLMLEGFACEMHAVVHGLEGFGVCNADGCDSLASTLLSNSALGLYPQGWSVLHMGAAAGYPCIGPRQCSFEQSRGA